MGKADTGKGKETGFGMRRTCSVCGRGSMDVFFQVEESPVFCNVLWSRREEAIAAPRAPIYLGFCNRCGLVYNVAFDAKVMEYSSAYENSLHFSPFFREYAQNLADQLISKYDLHDKDVIEIGCGRGDFLALLCERGGNRGVGFDPSYAAENNIGDSVGSRVVILPKSYLTAGADYEADFICCRHVLEHIDEPLEFLIGVRDVMSRRSGGVVYFEVPNALCTFERMGVWDIIYEHCSYFTDDSARNLFEIAGFDCAEVSERYGGQFIGIEARVAKGRNQRALVSLSRDTAGLVRDFARSYKQIVQKWRQRLGEFAQRREKVVIWGAGSKGVMFLNTLDISCEQVPYAVDVNPRKHNRFIPGTAQQVVAPGFVKDYQPQTIVVMNPVYVPEIQQMLKQHGVETELIVA